MKKFLFSLLFLFFIPSLADCAYSPPIRYDKPDIVGFRDMRWGDPISQFSSEMIQINKRYTEDGELIEKMRYKRYIKKNENLRVGDAVVERIEYVFSNDKLNSVKIYTNTYSNWLALKEYIEITYDEKSDRHWWERESGYIQTGYIRIRKPEYGLAIFASSTFF